MQTAQTGVHPRTLLSLLWVVFLLNIVFKDIHQFLAPGYLDQVIAGKVASHQLTGELLLYCGFAVEALLLMIIVPVLLPRAAVQVVNPLGVAVAGALLALTQALDLDDVIFLAVGVVTLICIAWIGWSRFRSQEGRPSFVSVALSVIVVGALILFASSNLTPLGIRTRGAMA